MIIESSMFLLGLVLGGMLYVTVLVAPIIFIVLDDPEATQFTRKLWPQYFIINGVLALLVALMIVFGTDWFINGLLVLTVSLMMVVNWILAMRMQTMRDPGSEYIEGSTYDWFHSITVWTNGLSIVLIIGVQTAFLWFG